MPLPNTQLRKVLFADRNEGESARDTQQSLDTVARRITKRFDTFYTEPLTIGSPLVNQQPEAIVLVRILNLNAPEQPVLCGSMVHWVWKPQNGGAVVTSIDGLSPSTSIKYRFYFEFSYTAQAGMV